MPEPKIFASIEEFRAAAKAEGGPGAVGRVRAGFDTTVKAGDGDSRTVTFTISTASVDRYGDTIAVDGWKLEHYRTNPVVLWAHDAGMLPLARAPKVWIDGGKLKAEAEFTPPGLAKFNDTVFEMYRLGFLNATSVGFLPLKYAFTDDPQRRYGIDFLEQELLEFSAVPVPANAEALQEGKAAGIDLAPLLDWAEGLLKRGDGGRVLRLAEGVLGKSGAAADLVAWARRIADGAGLAVVERDRVERIERAAKAQRLARRRQRDLDIIRLRAG